ncbi:unnamed protein product [Adineta ricciae]|uniref:Uncharacterized protein n=1 Tax=Adineta ricciae TaxID=249248 RepID=A0A815RCM7_ADIRI|nr:unnamed protein product [Adineta ricciae]CAF1652379.1 unnamed protein product [Adineta ricciae]
MGSNIFSELTSIMGDAVALSNEIGKGVKRTGSDEPQGPVKKSMVDYNPSKEPAPISIPKPVDQPKFITASQMIYEISDEELLKMAVEFEKKHLQ